MYLDKLDGRIKTAFYDPKAAAWRQGQQSLTSKINDLRQPTTGYRAAIDAIAAISNLCQSYNNLPTTSQ